MDDVLVEAMDRYPELVGVRWEDGRAVAQFKGEARKDALDLLSSAGTEVEYELVKYSTAELDGFLSELENAIVAMGIEDFVVAIDPVGQRIIASVSTAGARLTVDGADISAESIADALPPEVADANIEIQVSDDPVAQPTTTYGGTDARVGTTFICTFGFTVVQGTSNGVATDAHCGDGLTKYRDWVTGVTHNLFFRLDHLGAWGDFEWFTTDGTEVDDFYTEGGNRRDVTGVMASVGQGQEILWYGRQTKNDWLDWVEFPIVNTSGPDRLACMHATSRIVGGDSGGPAYLLNTSAGLMWGWVSIDGVRRDCFSQARYIDDALGVTIKR